MVAVAVLHAPTGHLPGGRGTAFKFGARKFISRAKCLRRDQHGTMLMEMAIVLPTFFMLLFGIFNYSIVLFGRGNAICAANVAARYASVHSAAALVPSTPASVKSVATAYLYAAPVAGTSITVNCSPGNTVGATVNVTIKVTYPTGIPFYGMGSITVSGSAERTISR